MQKENATKERTATPAEPRNRLSASEEGAKIAGSRGLGPRFVTFPEDHSVGYVYVRASKPSQAVSWTLLRKAQGRFLVQGGMELRLKVDPAAKGELSFLREIDPDALQALALNDAGVTDALLPTVAIFRTLHTLALCNNPVTDAGLESLTNLPLLRDLDLSGTRITDAGLEHLKKLRMLEQLNLFRTAVTEAGVATLRADLPKCRILRQTVNR